MKTKYRIILVIVATCVTVSTTLASFNERQRITSTPRGVGAQHGNAVAISGSTMVVGARFDSTTASQAGAAFVYVLSGGTWTQQAVLLAGDGALSDKFGYSVAISEDTIVVGSYNDDAPLSNGGSAYVFVRNGTTWSFQQKLTAGDGTADDEFGSSVAITGEVIVVGAHFADLPGNSQAGSAYVFRRSGTVWAQTQKLIPVAAVPLGDHFGESVAVSGSTLAVGASGDDTPETAAGAVYLYNDSGGNYASSKSSRSAAAQTAIDLVVRLLLKAPLSSPERAKMLRSSDRRPAVPLMFLNSTERHGLHKGNSSPMTGRPLTVLAGQ